MEWDEDELAQLILLTWRDRVPNNPGPKTDEIRKNHPYREFVSSQPGGIDPLAVPEWLFGPLAELVPVSASDRVNADDHLRGVFLELGRWSGSGTPPGAAVEPPRVMSTADMLANETREERRMRKAIGLALMTPMIVLAGWYLRNGLGL